MSATQKVRDYLFGNPSINACNELLKSCRNNKERKEVAASIRSKIPMNSFTDLLVSNGLIENFNTRPICML